jgi:hypothetical protein
MATDAIDWGVTRRLATGSAPAAIITVTVLFKLGLWGGSSPPLITIVLACGLIFKPPKSANNKRWLK